MKKLLNKNQKRVTKWSMNGAKWLKKIVVCLLLALLLSANFAVFATSDSQTAYAAASTCPEGWTEKDPTKPGKCQPPAGTDKCPDKDNYVPTFKADKTLDYCSKKIVASGESTAQLLNYVALLSGVQQFLNKLIWPVLVMIGDLMDNSLLFANGMEERLQDIWIPIRNIVNILFVIVLVGIALYNVLGIGDDNSTYSIKAALPKIVIGIIAVNFSFLGIKVFLDGINVLTTAVFNLPGDVSQGLEKIIEDSNNPDGSPNLGEAAQERIKRLCANLQGLKLNEIDAASTEELNKLKKEKIYRAVATDVGLKNTDSVEAIETKLNEKGNESHKAKVKQQMDAGLCDGAKLSDQGKLFLARYNSRNAAFAMALNMSNIVFYQETNVDSLKDAEKLLTNTLFSVMLYLVFMASFLALFIVLLGRLVVMWLCIAISPILLIAIAAPELKDKIGGVGKLSEIFVKNAIAPLIISLAMTIGWIMLKAIQGLNPGGQSFSSGSAFTIDPTNGIPIVGLNSLQDFTVAIATIAVVWLGVFSAAEGTIAEFATNWLKESVTKAGKYIGSIPLRHIPAVPIRLPSGEQRQYTLQQLGRAVENKFIDTKADELIKDLGETPPAKPTDLRNVDTPDGLYSHLKRSKDNLESDDNKDEIKRWLGESKNKPIIDKIKLQDGGPKLIEDMEALSKEGDKEERKKIAKRILANDNVNRQSDTAPPPKKSDDATKPKTNPAKTVDKDGKMAGGGDFRGKYNDDNTTDKEANINMGIAKFNESIATLATKTEKDTGDKTAIETILNGMRYNKNKVAATPEEIKAHIGTKNYDNMVKIMGGGSKGEAAILAALDKNKPSAPPAAGGPPPPSPAPTPPAAPPAP